MSQFANLLDKRVQVAQTTGNGSAIECQGLKALTAYIVGSAGVSAGAVQLEEAHDKDYAGTWSAIGSPTTVVADTVSAVHVQGTFKAVRARISTNVVGGTVTVLLVGN